MEANLLRVLVLLLPLLWTSSVAWGEQKELKDFKDQRDLMDLKERRDEESKGGSSTASLADDEEVNSEEVESEEEEEDEESEEEEDSEAEEPPLALFGEPIHQVGPIVAEYLYTGEIFNNTRGGLSTRNATRYRGNFDLTLTLETEAAKWWQGGTIFAYLHQGHGRTLSSNFVGDGQFYSSIDTGPDQDVTRLGELWYQHANHDESLLVRLGRQDANTEFAFADLGGDFINASFVTLPNVSFPTWPFQTVGLTSLYQTNDQLRVGAAIFDHGVDHSQWWMTTTSRGMFYIAQIDYEPFADIPDLPLMILRLGAWYTSSNAEALDGSREFAGNYGFYATVDRMLLPEANAPDQGLGSFLQTSWAPNDRNQVDWHYGAGFVYRGLLSGRDVDTAGIGYTTIDFASQLRSLTGQTNETAVELFYRMRLKKCLAIQPDLQYIARPNGELRDALLVGIRFDAKF